MRHQHLDRWFVVATQAIRNGATHGEARNVLKWNVAGNCERPVERTYKGSKAPNLWQEFKRENSFTAYLDMDVRCRQCPSCLKARAFHWRMRCQQEMASTQGRTWFGTLTLSPEQHFRLEAIARLRLAKRGTSWNRLTDAEQLAERHAECSREITLWLKRVRKELADRAKRDGLKIKPGLRYLLCMEVHKSGLPHYHIMVHETSLDGPVRERTLRKQWTLGFSKFNLVAEGENTKAANYVTKYLTKHALVRVRASQGYGHCDFTP